jgi:hypothetical protein
MNNDRPENKLAAKRAGDLPAPLPLENGKPRVQRLVDQLAPVHL